MSQTKRTRQQSTTDQAVEAKQISTVDRMKEMYYFSFIFVFSGIIVCYSIYAYLQESLLADQSKNISASLVISIQGLVGMTISFVIIQVGGMGSIVDNFRKQDALVAFLTFFSMFCSNTALKYVSFPIQALAKSSKVLSVILCGVLMGSLKLRKDQIPVALFITLGLIIFNSKKLQGIEDSSLTGYGLVLTSLLSDGLTSASQDKNHKESKRDFAYFTMFYNNLCHFALNGVIFAVQAYLFGDDSVNRLMQNSNLMKETIYISLCGAFGQIFIFLGISIFGAFTVSIATTARKCFSVVASANLFGHQFSSVQWTGAYMVLISSVAEVYFGAQSKKKVRQD